MKILNSKKANVGPIGAIFLLVFFIIIWFIWLGGWVAKVGSDMVATNGIVGVEAFFYYNLNLFIMLAMILGTMGYMYFGANSQ